MHKRVKRGEEEAPAEGELPEDEESFQDDEGEEQEEDGEGELVSHLNSINRHYVTWGLVHWAKYNFYRLLKAKVNMQK